MHMNLVQLLFIFRCNCWQWGSIRWTQFTCSLEFSELHWTWGGTSRLS